MSYFFTCIKWSLDTSASAVASRKQQLMDEKVYPLQQLLSFIVTNEEEVIDALIELKDKKSWSDTVMIKYLFSLLMEGNFYKNIKYLSHFVKSSNDMMLVLSCIEKYIEEQDGDIVTLLNGFYEEGVVGEEEIFKWHQSQSKVVSQELSNTIRHHAKPFIEWLEKED